MPATELDQVVNLCKRRGFVYPSAEIYGGFRSTYDYGPLGALMLRNVRDAWIRSMVQQRDDVVLIDAAVLGPPQVWEASRATLPTSRIRWSTAPTARTGFDSTSSTIPTPARAAATTDTFTEPRQFNLMFKTHAGPVEEAGAVAYLRPETAQGMFINFATCCRPTRKKPPFGIAQVGKSFRNEITPQNLDLPHPRVRADGDGVLRAARRRAPKWYEYWCSERMNWYLDLGIPTEMLRLRPHDADELSHYSTGTSDVEFLFPWGWDELEGIAQRTDYDLTQHAKHSGEKLDYFDQATNERYVPYVIEPAAGVTRLLAALPAGRIRRRRRQRRAAHGAAAAPPPRAVQGRRAAAVEEGHADARWRTKCSQACSATATWSTTTRRRRSAGDTAARTRSVRRCASPSTSIRSTISAVTIRDRDTTEQVRVPIDALLAEVGSRLGF